MIGENKNIYEFEGIRPTIHPSSFVHPLACIIGNVVIGKSVYVGPGAVIRGDWGKVIIEDECNVQENCVIHMFPGTTVTLRKQAHIGHGAVIHGATISENCLVGMNAVVMDDAVINKESIVGALCFVPSGMQVPERSIVVGNPARVVKKVSDERLEWKTKGTELYSSLPLTCMETLKQVKPHRNPPVFERLQQVNYQIWSKTKKDKK